MNPYGNSNVLVASPASSPTTLGNTWSVISPTQEYITKLCSLVHPVDTLGKSRYVTRPLTAEELLAKRRCENCGQRKKKQKEKPPAAPSTRCYNCKGSGHYSPACQSPDVGIEQRQRNKAEIQRENRQKTQEGSSTPVELSDSSTLGMQLGVAMIGGETSLEVLKQEQQERNERKKAVCQYHFGEVVNKYFTCCFGHTSSDGCILSDQHSFAPDASGYLEHEWKFHSTPTPRPQPAARLGVTSNRSRRRLGSVIPSQEHRLAIALDCEMGTAQSRNSELIRLTVVDFFTGATLIDSLVVPSVPMLHYNTRYSGVTFAMMREASRSGNCIRGRDAAREALWRFVGPETVVVLHGGENDTIALRWMCGKVVDTFLLAGNMKEGKIKGGRSLKNLNLELLGRNVQMGRKGHDSLEDALATRELANWFIERGETL